MRSWLWLGFVAGRLTFDLLPQIAISEGMNFPVRGGVGGYMPLDTLASGLT